MRHARSPQQFARASWVKGGRFSTCDSRFSAVHIRLPSLQELHGWMAALSLAPHTFVLRAS
eukprot:8840633-Pyramimonas_sp.AAC.1